MAIFSIIDNPDESFKKFKARLVARVDVLKNLQDPDTFAGTVRANTLRLLLSLAAEHDLDIVSHDIKTAFLYSDLKPNDIYLSSATSVIDDIMPYIVKLKKRLYGLPKHPNTLMITYPRGYMLWVLFVVYPMMMCFFSRMKERR